MTKQFKRGYNDFKKGISICPFKDEELMLQWHEGFKKADSEKIKERIDSRGLVFECKNDTYIIEYIDNAEARDNGFIAGGFNLKSNRGLNHYHNGLLHATFEAAYKYLKQQIAQDNEENN